MSTKVRNGQNVFGNACGTPASAKKHFSLVAGFPQAPKSGFSLLRDSRKRQKAVFPRCGNPAKPKKHFFLVAEIPRAPKSSFCSLRDSRKHFRKHFVRPSTLTKTWCGRKEPHSYIELTLKCGVVGAFLVGLCQAPPASIQDYTPNRLTFGHKF